jgi:3-deoxy-D-manno-octulosonate 8-phosphate phosphatase (KDO 8-P phosphatase)
LQSINLLILDVDGVLTDGRIIYDDHGSQIKEFSVRDGLGIRLLMKAGIQVGIITGRTSKALVHRCKDLCIPFLFQGVKNKCAELDRLLKQTGIPPADTAYAGDDLPDLSVMKKVGIPIAVSDACSEVVSAAEFVTSAKGGHGAVREICEAILQSKGVWHQVLERFGA